MEPRKHWCGSRAAAPDMHECDVRWSTPLTVRPWRVTFFFFPFSDLRRFRKYRPKRALNQAEIHVKKRKKVALMMIVSDDARKLTVSYRGVNYAYLGW